MGGSRDGRTNTRTPETRRTPSRSHHPQRVKLEPAQAERRELRDSGEAGRSGDQNPVRFVFVPEFLGPFFIRGSFPAAALLEDHETIHRASGESLLVAVGPDDLDDLHVGGGPESEVNARIVAGAVTITGLDQTPPAA